MNSFIYDMPIGKVEIVEEDGKIRELNLTAETPLAGTVNAQTPLIIQACEQFREYFAGKRTCFTLPLAPKGTAFQQKVWQALQEIPYGKTASYKDIAEKIGCPKGCRAVGMANNKNPIAIVIPCHRVIGCDGKLVGYAGGLEMKEKLLHLENSTTLFGAHSSSQAK